MKIAIYSVLGVVALLALVWFTDLGGLKSKLFVNQIVKMRVSPERLENVKTPKDYGMDFKDVDIVTADNVRLSAWEIPAPVASNKTIIINHALTTTRYGAVEGLDGVPVEYLPMLKHLHDAGYNIVTYDHRGQGDSDGGIGKSSKGVEAPVGAGVTEWQDVVGSLQYVKNHSEFGDDEISFISQCMGANATFLAWKNEPEMFADPQIKSLVAIQPTISHNMIDRMITLKTGMNLVDAVEASQKGQYGFGYANALETVDAVSVPILFSQVRNDQYTFDAATGKNDIEQIANVAKSTNEIVWIGPDEAKPFGTGKRFDGYGYFNAYPEELLDFLATNFK